LLVDYDEAYFAEVYTDGEIKKIFSEQSYVPKKHKKGGQSAARFARIREEKIKQWFKKINELLKSSEGEIIIGISSIYQNHFKKYLSSSNQRKILSWEKSEYSSLSGIYQMINKKEKEKN